MKYKVALLIGRFQPFHLGHLYLLKKTLSIANKVIVGIGSASIFDENNPLSFETRKQIVKAVFYKEKVEEKLLGIVPLEDYFDDDIWLKNVKKQVGRFDIIVSNNNWTNSIMIKAGFKVKRFPYYKRNLYEGWRIRKLIRKNKNQPSQKFQRLRWQDRIPDYLLHFFTNHQSLITSHFEHVVLGGTFDHFHKGHEKVIRTGFNYGKKVTIGIATEELYKNKVFSDTIESFEIRKKSVSNFLKKNKWQNRAKILSISEFTGGVDKRADIDAIVVSRITYSNALKINERRINKGLKLLRIIIVKDIVAEDKDLISSERIRSGEIDRSGRNYKLPTTNYKLIMPDILREELRKPLGKVFDSVHKVINFIKLIKPIQTIAVGDIIVESLLKNNINSDINVIDFRSRRKEFFPDIGKVKLPKEKFLNKPGTINLKTADKLKELIKKGRGWMVVEGEEDLLTLPAILFAPLESLVIYGHWQLGIIGVKVNEKIKEKTMKILKKFK